MKKIKNCTNIFITILLMCAIVITMLSGFVRFSLTNKDICLNLLEKTNTYAEVTDSLYNKMSSILGDDISEDLKKSIITEEDVKKEAEVVLDCMINNMINGQSIAPEIYTDIYKERIAEALKSLTGYDAYMKSRKDLASSNFVGDYVIEPMNLVINSDIKSNNSYLKVDNSETISDELFFKNLATRAELEAQGRAMLRERGMTEAQARAKLAEKGISEEQVWQYLRDNGYLDSEENGAGESLDSSTGTSNNSGIDNDSEDKDGNKDKNELETDIEKTEYPQGMKMQGEDADDSKVSKKKIQNIVMSIILEQNMSFEKKMDKLYLELMKEAEIIINKEINSLNISNLVNSTMFKISVKISSILYKSFYFCLALSAVLILISGVINGFDFINLFNNLSKSLLISGILSSGLWGYVYVSKVYINFSGMFSKSYLQTMFLAACEYFCRVLSIYSAGIFISGLIMSIFIIQKRVSRR